VSVSVLVASVAFASVPSELRWGADSEGGAPYTFEQPPGHLRGFEAELAQLLATRLGRTARHVQGPFAQLLPLLERGDVEPFDGPILENRDRDGAIPAPDEIVVRLVVLVDVMRRERYAGS